jgi:hypothetical protein
MVLIFLSSYINSLEENITASESVNFDAKQVQLKVESVLEMLQNTIAQYQSDLEYTKVTSNESYNVI